MTWGAWALRNICHPCRKENSRGEQMFLYEALEEM